MRRRNGKTTRMCQRVAQWLEEHPEGIAVIMGPHVIRNVAMYKGMLRREEVDLRRVRFVADLQSARGYSALFLDDFGDYPRPQRMRWYDDLYFWSGHLDWGETS